MHLIESLRQSYQQYALAHPFAQNHPKELYEPLDYILALGGKQMRPILLLMAADLFDKKSVERALPAAYAVELFHNFSLIHDDIMDAAPLRRGKATVHTKFGTNTAILSGDVMLVYAYQYLAQNAGAVLPQILQVFNETAIGVCEGQQMDMNFETRLEVSIPEYIRMIELKTSVLLHGAMKIGALIAGASAADADHIAEFGRNMGIAFQLQDDYLDSFGDEATFGKRIGGDIVQNKKTYLFLKALQLCDAAQQKSLLSWYNNPVSVEMEPQKIAEVKALFLESGAAKALSEEMGAFHQKALNELAAISLSAETKAPLVAFADYLMQRQV